MGRIVHALLVAAVFLGSLYIGGHILRELYLVHAVSRVAYFAVGGGLISAIILFYDFRKSGESSQA